MTAHHQFSPSLFSKLFKHNMVTSDGIIKASDAQLIQFRKFMVQEKAQKTAALYKIRKEMVDEVLSLLQEDRLNPRQTKRFQTLLHKLNMKVTEDGTLEGIHRPIAISEQSDASEAPLSVWERKMETEERRLRGLKSDLKELTDWLREISKPSSKAKSESGDGQHRDCKRKTSKKKVSKQQFGARPKTSSGISTKKDKGSSRVTVKNIVAEAEHQIDQKDANNIDSKEKLLAFEPYPQESLDVMLSNEQTKLKTSKYAFARRKGSFDRDSLISGISNEGPHPAALDEFGSSQMIFEKSTGWKNDLKTRVFQSNSSTKNTRKKRKELLTHVHDVTKVSSSDFQANEEYALSDILEFFPMLQKRVFVEEMAQSGGGWDDDSDGVWDDVEEGEVVLYTKNRAVCLGRNGKNGKMAEDLFPAELEPSLDEMLRKEAEERSQKMRHSQNEQ